MKTAEGTEPKLNSQAPPMKNLIVEISQFKLASGMSEEEFLKEAEEAETTFFEKQGGYIGSELLKDKSNQWAKVTNWNSMEDVRKAAKAMLNSPVAQSLMQKIDSSSILCNFYEKVPPTQSKDRSLQSTER